MTKKPKSRKVKPAKQRARGSFVVTFFFIICRLLFWLVRKLYFFAKKNTIFFIGIIIFTISVGFISVNALFLQLVAYQDILVKTKSVFASNAERRTTLSTKGTNLRTRVYTSFTQPLDNLHTNPPTQSIPNMQKKLAEPESYDGPLDGIDGPKTRRAIALRKQQTASRMQNAISSTAKTDEIAEIIKRSEIEMTTSLLRPKGTNLEHPIAEIEQVQKALRAFGHQEVAITGVEDQKTTDAVKQFQEAFNLPITGKIDKTILAKMREIGLFN